jgi:hypothetical protein
MRKTTPLFVLGIIVLFLGVSYSPVLAETVDTVTITYIDENGGVSLQTLSLSETELQELNGIFSNLMETIRTAPDYATAVSLAEVFIKGCCRNQKIQGLLSTMTRSLFRQRIMYPNNPFNQNLLVMSSGFTNKMMSMRGTHMNMHRFFTSWFYSANSNLLVNSQTIILDPNPFNIKTLTGRQIGMMRGFTGFYIVQHSTIADKEYTFFIGHARAIRGVDLAL